MKDEHYSVFFKMSIMNMGRMMALCWGTSAVYIYIIYILYIYIYIFICKYKLYILVVFFSWVGFPQKSTASTYEHVGKALSTKKGW